MAWTYSRPVTLDHTKVPNTDLTNFAVGLWGTLTYLKTVANGGKVQHGSGFDIAFFSDSGLTTALKFERVVWDATTGLCLFYVKIPTLSHTSDTVIYLAYGNSSISTDQQDVANTWNANLHSVYHLGDGTTLSLNDSTSNANHLTNINTATAGASPFSGGGGGSVTVNGTTQYLRRTTSAPVTAVPVAISCLFNPTAAADAAIVAIETASAVGQVWELTQRLTSALLRASTLGTNAASTASYTAGAWNYAMARFVSSTSRFIHVNGAAGVQNTTSSTPAAPDDIAIGARFNNGSVASNFFGGSIGEVRVYNVDPGADWAAAEYNNLVGHFSSAFFTIGSESSSNTPPPAPTWSGSTPADGTEVAKGASITLDARSTDAEDGALTGASVVYEYKLNPLVGSPAYQPIGSPSTGQTALTWAPPDGHYTVRATVTDSNGASASSTLALHVNRYAIGATWTYHDFYQPFSDTTGRSYFFTPYHWPKTGPAIGATIEWRNGAGESTGSVSGTGPYTLGLTNSNGLLQIETNVPRLATIYATDASTIWQHFLIVTQTMLVGSIPVGHPYKNNTAMRKRGQIDLDEQVRAYALANWNLDTNRFGWGGHSAGASEGLYKIHHYARAPYSVTGGFQYAFYLGSESTWIQDDHAAVAAGTTWTSHGVTLGYYGLDNTAYPLTAKGNLDAKVAFESVVPLGVKFLFFAGTLDTSISGIAQSYDGVTTPYPSPLTFITPDYAGVDPTTPYKGGLAEVLQDKRGTFVARHRDFTGTEAVTPNFMKVGQDYATNIDVFDTWDGYHHNNQLNLFSSPQINSGTSGVSIYQLDPRNTNAMNWIAARTRAVRFRRTSHRSGSRGTR